MLTSCMMIYSKRKLTTIKIFMSQDNNKITNEYYNVTSNLHSTRERDRDLNL